MKYYPVYLTYGLAKLIRCTIYSVKNFQDKILNVLMLTTVMSEAQHSKPLLKYSNNDVVLCFYECVSVYK